MDNKPTLLREVNAQNGRITTQIERFLLQSWWVVLFAFCCLLAYYGGLRRFHEDELFLTERKNQLLMEKEAELEIRQRQVLQIESEKDPAWIELVLMKALGVVPEDQQKVFFLKQAAGESR